MDLNEIKNRAKDILADLTDNRPDREARPGSGRADDGVDDSAVRTDRLEQPLQRPATDPHDAHPRDADLSAADLRDRDRDPEFRDAGFRDPDLGDPDLRDTDRRDAELRDPDVRDQGFRDADRRDADRRDSDRRDSDLRDSDLRDSDLRDSDLRDSDLRDAELRNPDLRDPDLRDADRRDADLQDSDLRDPLPPRESRDRAGVPAQPAAPAPLETVAPPERYQDPAAASADQLDAPGRHHLRDTAAAPATPDALDSDGLPADPDRLVTAERAQSYGARWDEVKGEFVDEPRQAVARADALVGELLDELGQLFTQQRRGIEQDLDNDEVSTEDLRVALRRYRSFFDRLLSV
jgi:uncharacterized protein YjbI with pentapeptide repeats